MATFILNSDIGMGIPGVNQLQFKGVNQVQIRRSIHSFEDTATITLPSVSTIKYKASVTPLTVPTAGIWNDGDPVTIKLGYGTAPNEEFRGFVKRRNLNMPLEIICEGYSWLLRKNKLTGAWKKISVKDLLTFAVSGLPNVGNETPVIKVTCTANIMLNNMQFTEVTGIDIINYIMRVTDNNLTIFFINPQELWCGLPYSSFQKGTNIFQLQQVKYHLGYNTLSDNELKERTLEDNMLNVSYVKKTATGERLFGKTDNKQNIKEYKKLLNHVADETSLKMLANEKQFTENYIGYEGAMTTFLQPFALPGYTALIRDDRYPTRDGIYLIEGSEITYGLQGARRKVEVGRKVKEAITTA